MSDNGVLASLSVLLHGESKVGKSTLACTAPPPLVVFDAEGSTKFLPMRTVRWDTTQPPPAYDGTWDAAVVIVNCYEDLDRGFQWLDSGQHQFRSVILDSITEMQRKLKDNIVGINKMQRDDWDELLRRMDGLLRGFRNLTQHPRNPMLMAVFVAETRMSDDGKYRPNLQGGIRTNVPYWFDIAGYLMTINATNPDGSVAHDENGEPFEVRRLLTRPTNPLYYAGQRVQGRVPAVIDGQAVSVPPRSMHEATPNLTTMLLQVFPHLAAPTE